jgi:[ribosomal protein S5]-alanine N-acetyltransferase
VAFLRAGTAADSAASIQGSGVWLRPPQMADYAAWAELRALSRAHLVPWEPAWPRDDLSRSAYRRRLRHYQREAREDLGYAFLIFECVEDRLVGGVTLSSIRRGVTQTAMLGYWLGHPFGGRGYMTDAVRAVLSHALEGLRLHRIEAAVQPENTRSAKVLERLGFRQEGLARSYLKINGTWQDHFLYGFLAEDWPEREGRI